MPDISDAVREDIELRLGQFLKGKTGYSQPTYVGAGGSAAIYKVDTLAGTRALKVYDPKFFSSENAQAEARRLELQRSLIGHDCPTLVKVFSVEEAEGTAFIEMEFVAWPQLKKVLASVPDEKISSLIQQLVEAVVFLEKLDIAHRDVKPENIHVTEDFSHLKLIDLGVSRTMSPRDEEGGDATDHGKKRPFIATAQYSSPEYLFRLDPPSPNLWKALNLYQVGAVLHDLVNKKPLFDDEVNLGNRWLVARAVLTKIPNFPDADPARLLAQKALATRCLAKDMETRLRIVSWSDFTFEAATDRLSALKSRLAKGKGLVGSQSAAAIDERLRFEREQFAKRFCESIRTELIAACDRVVHVTMMARGSGRASGYEFLLGIGQRATVSALVCLDWFDDMNSNSARASIAAAMSCGSGACPTPEPQAVAVATIGESEEAVSLDVARRLADILMCVLDLLDSAEDAAALHGTDVGKLIANKDVA
ncbi:serine/threonine protein kinase [Dyella jiangningensis]|uniref:protein kinase domain-containing protein n=1 Tax=Dyella sp. AtDHG13 TaxID=1938897 RepID=UPI00088A6524|nr:protein kinase [Dyella sp. AtDHG13]PXV52086.1 serine/threonine-protein kinase [Dyella sp. AtDHG13]SDL55947.1 serine/threonine protein kinase [Dyella jiangningensis]